MEHSQISPNAPVVLVVEDEMLPRILIVAAFEDAGFKVLSAGNAEEAIVVLKHNGDYLHVLFTDIDMPGGMDGVLLASHTREHWPWVGIVVTSGKASPSAEALPERARFFSKPYVPDQVVAHIREIVSAAA
jgi:CheY-like chemotaxis protein